MNKLIIIGFFFIIGCSGLKEFPVIPGDEYFTATIQGTGKPIITKEGDNYSIKLKLGEEKLFCTFGKTKHNTAQSFLRKSIDRLSDLKIKDYRSYNIDSATVGGKPYIYFDINFTGRDKKRSIFKAITSTFNHFTLYCYHNSSGSVTDFKKATKTLIGTMKFKDKKISSEQPYHEIQIVRYKKLKTGFKELKSFRLKDGNILQEYTTSFLVPNEKNKIHKTYDNFGSELTSSDGTLIDGAYHLNINGRQIHSLTLKNLGKGQYSVAGEFSKQKINEKFTSTNSIFGKYIIPIRILEHFIGKKKKYDLVITQYDPEINQLSAITSLYSLVKTSNKDRLLIRQVKGNRTMAILSIDNRGQVFKSKFNFKRFDMSSHRILLTGNY